MAIERSNSSASTSSSSTRVQYTSIIPKARINRTDEWKVTIVNNSTASPGYEVYAGVKVNAAVQAAAVNIAGSFFTHRVPTDGTVPNIYTANGQSYFLEHGKAYELYSTTTGVEIRQITRSKIATADRPTPTGTPSQGVPVGVAVCISRTPSR